jgi:hypothetical protein
MKGSQMFLDTVHFSARRHFGVVLDAEGFILGKTPMFRTAKQAMDAARALRDDIAASQCICVGGFVADAKGVTP